ncbi:hypothetical protein HPB52_025568 [Rhipicephalus sanguineus]|uniref:Uncharacterized protein n=1 Tax=Rhipicephalus sanguineus TaxID=34632 RepID=A0A9D4SM80_RHISA|nr:hypothetical protein HPB52_025568 [Rhipicephalus sanguineus]
MTSGRPSSPSRESHPRSTAGSCEENPATTTAVETSTVLVSPRHNLANATSIPDLATPQTATSPHSGVHPLNATSLGTMVTAAEPYAFPNVFVSVEAVTGGKSAQGEPGDKSSGPVAPLSVDTVQKAVMQDPSRDGATTADVPKDPRGIPVMSAASTARPPMGLPGASNRPTAMQPPMGSAKSQQSRASSHKSVKHAVSRQLDESYHEIVLLIAHSVFKESTVLGEPEQPALSPELTAGKVFLAICYMTCTTPGYTNPMAADCKRERNSAYFAEAYECPKGSRINPEGKRCFFD